MGGHENMITRRGQLKASITRFSNYLQSQNIDSTEVKARREKIEDVWAEYEQVQSAIEMEEGSNIETQNRYRAEFEDLYFKTIAIAEKIVIAASSVVSQDENTNKNTNTDIPNACMNKVLSSVKLSSLSVPVFTGNYQEWASFYDIFSALIDNNASLTAIEKFFYLRESLSGEALSSIKCLETTGNNYIIAWQSLITRYNNKRVLVQTHVKAIYDLETVGGDSAKRLRQFTDALNGHMRALEALGQEPTNWGPLLMHIILIKLDKTTLKEWEARAPCAEVPKLSELITFLDSRFKILESIETVKNINIKAHNTLLHLPGGKNTVIEGSKAVQSTVANVSTSEVIEESTSLSAHASVIQDDKVLLSTAMVSLRNESGQWVPGRVLLDSGSQSNLITEEMVQLLKLKKKHVKHDLCGIGGSTQKASSAVVATIAAEDKKFTLTVTCLVVKRITNNLPSKLLNDNILIPRNIKLADPWFNTPRKIDLLIGAGYFYELLRTGQLRPSSGGPIYQETCFGWVVSGPADNVIDAGGWTASAVNLSLAENKETDLEQSITKFWKLEEYESKSAYTKEEKECEAHFNKNLNRDESGRFIVKLPFKVNAPKLGNSYNIAERRFLLLEKRLQRDPKLKQDYVKFMSEYEALGHMERVNKEIENKDGEKKYYIPHHAVRNDSSTTTKLRVVFDASSKTDAGVSLNDILLKGPSIQDDLIYILIRFRTYNYVFSADIVKMYRQFLVVEDQRDFQRVLWRPEPTQPICIYRLNTLTYGTVPASYLATACLKKLAESECDGCPEVGESIIRDFYMDDFLGGAMLKGDAIKLRDNLISIMSKAGLELRKWLSNDPELIADVHSDNNSIRSMGEQMTKILGLHWKSDDDMLFYTVQQVEVNAPITKRKILSEIATIFDPLGLLGPIIIIAKIIMQSLWQIKLNWDDVLPDKICTEWQRYRDGLPSLNNLRIPRKIISNGILVNTEVHGFADASEKAYGACLYLRTTGVHGKTEVKLICAKSKVAPLKIVSLPRLELCAALLLARLSSRMIPKLNLKIDRRRFWIDSKVVLVWITSPSGRWKTFVAHRVGEIQELTACSEWSHVSTHDNAADVISRGCNAEDIGNKSIWWFGPEWLIKDADMWPKPTNVDKIEIEKMPEEKSNVTSNTYNFTCTLSSDFSLLNNRSSLKQIIRITAYCLRWRNNGLKSRKSVVGQLDVKELEYANLALIKMIQRTHFQKEINELKSPKAQVAGSSVLLRLRPFCDENDILRVGGRLANAIMLSEFQRHPIVLPRDSTYTRLLFQSEHVNLLHSGPQALVASIRQRYWPLGARSIARKIVHSCITCFKQKPIIVQPIMGNLPRDRITYNRPFSRCGVDFAGPIMIKSSLRRNAPCDKGYISIFVCFATKAIHIELVSDLTTKTFLQTLNRFFDRRGRSAVIYSDNATNFVGARRQLQDVFNLFQSDQHQDAVFTALSEKGVEWKVIPPRSPHFGGLWEAAVKSMKNLLFKVLGESRLTYEEMSTVLTRVEACLNSRPITSLSSDPSDLSYLTPGHFLIGDTITAVPERDETTTSLTPLERWRRVTQYSQLLWKRWSTEYLGQLQERAKWTQSKGPKLKVGSVVLIRDANLPPLQWRLGRVLQLHVGKDGVSRSARQISVC
ncbi:uncharacterized protein LOC114130946 [Aphis gossypii]|uniref:uncharacterized protein LOC114130946 n=1 Tax=Aphis gossypii TaxID=80765 RepID=UPI0021597020|nr:uncharacterized protein LOC114130946 [Aphis gossypii]